MRLQSRVCTASVAFAVRFAARLSLCDLTTRQASLHATDRPVAPPVGLLTLGFDAGRFPPTPPVCYRASWQLPGPDLHRQAMTSLRSKDQLQHQPHLRSTGRTPEEIEASVLRVSSTVRIFAVDDLGFVGMHFKVAFGEPSCKLRLYGCGFSFCSTMYQPVIRIPAPREVWVLSCHPCIKRVVQKKIREYRTDHPPNAKGNFGYLTPSGWPRWWANPHLAD